MSKSGQMSHFPIKCKLIPSRVKTQDLGTDLRRMEKAFHGRKTLICSHEISLIFPKFLRNKLPSMAPD